jgi:putative FmdB family regulatory protein
MPTYDYQCDKCGSHSEKFEKMTDKPRGICPKCGGKTRRLIAGGSGVIFKGTGFYETDYKKKQRPCPKSDGGSCKGCPSSGD